MRITQEADYAIRMCCFLSTVEGTKDATTISESASVPQRFALKILRKLADQYSNVGLHFNFNAVAYKKDYEDILALRLIDFSQYIKAYVVSLFGRYALDSIRNFVLDARHIIDTPASEIYGVTDAISISHPMLCVDFLSSLPSADCTAIERLAVALETYNDHAVASGRQRTLAAFETYMVFGELMERFWNAELTAAERLFYFPLYFWWRFTGVIPLRPREFLLLGRNCLSKRPDGTYTIQVRRNKIKGGQKAKAYKISDDYIEQPLELPSELGDLLQEYIDITEEYDGTDINTLFIADPHYHKWGRKKFSRSRFLTYTNLTTILRYFYREIICGKYGYSIVDDSTDRHLSDLEIGMIHLGDTRHIAMINLMQSGGTPVIAMILAGHDNLITGSHYYSNLTRMIECRTYRQYRKCLGGDTTCNIVPVASTLPSVAESQPLQDGGRCYSHAYQEGSIDDCIEVMGPNGEIGYCPKCRYYRRDNNSFWGADDFYKREISSDCEVLRQAVQIVREGKGYPEDIYEALLRLRASSLSYETYLAEKIKNDG